jgi:hypothetical protein
MALICGSRELTIYLDENEINLIVNELRKCLEPIIETGTNSLEEVGNEWKCELEDREKCFPENERKGYECCVSFDVLDRMISGFQTIKECHQRMISKTIEELRLLLENTKTDCPQYGYHSKKCKRLKNLRSLVIMSPKPTLSPVCGKELKEIQTHFEEELVLNMFMKCGKSETECGTDFEEVFKMAYCCSAYELLDGIKDEIKKVEECDQKDIEVFVNKMNIKLRNTQKVCLQYGYQSDKCSKLRSNDVSIKPTARVLYLMAALFIAFYVF